MVSSQWFMWIGLGIVAAFIVGQFVRYPSQMFWKLAKSAVLGCLFVFAVDWIGQYFHYHLPFNPLTAATAGILGIPGVAALVALNLWVFPQ